MSEEMVSADNYEVGSQLMHGDEPILVVENQKGEKFFLSGEGLEALYMSWYLGDRTQDAAEFMVNAFREVMTGDD